MLKVPRGARLIVASHNQGKVREIGALLAPLGVAALSAGTLGLAEPEETGDSFAANAELKALAAAKAGGHPALADDSGLCVEALDGAPGIFSARWAGPNKDFAVAIARVQQELRDRKLTGSPAGFVCALTLAWPDGACRTFMGTVHGRVDFPPRGTQGFGYDPIFTADTMDQTFAEMDPGHKHAISHRARAFARLLESGLLGGAP